MKVAKEAPLSQEIAQGQATDSDSSVQQQGLLGEAYLVHGWKRCHTALNKNALAFSLLKAD